MARDHSYFYLVRPRPNLEVQCEEADCGVSPGHPRGREGIQLRDTYTVEWISLGPPWGELGWRRFRPFSYPSEGSTAFGWVAVKKGKFLIKVSFLG